MAQMNKKLKYEQYQICANFKNENCLVLTAQFLPTQQVFSKDDVELTRIKKDTVFATLQRKSQKNLRCELQQIICDGQKYLIISFIVNFDYLPEFKEQIKLQFVQKKEQLKSISVNSFHGEIDQMEKILNSFKKNGLTIHHQSPAINAISSTKQLWNQSINPGKYILRISSIVMNSSGGGPTNDQITFTFQIPGNQKKKTVCTAFTQYGYPYPVSLSQIVEAQNQGQLKINVVSTSGTCNLSTTHIQLNPILELS